MKKSKVPILLLLVFCCIIVAGTAFGLNKVTETAAGGTADMAMQEEQLAEVLQVKDEQGDEISLTELPEENYDGFIFKIEDSVGKQQVEQKLEDAVDDGAVDCIAEDLYTADDLQVIIDNVDGDKLEYVEPNYIVNMIGEVEELDSSELAPNDKLYQNGKQWNLDMMNVFEAWGYDTYGANLDTGEPVKVAVIDSGLYGTGSSESKHEDIDYSKVIAGINLATSSAGTPDSEGHGTFVSGMIFAQINNDKGIAGIMPQVNIVPIKVFDTDSCSTAVVIEGINKAVEYGVDVINMSLGGEGSSTALKEACDNAAAAGILVVAAAGNDGTSVNNYPAAYDSVIGVASLDSDKSRSYFSQYGDSVFVSAPGASVTSLSNSGATGYATGSGTSFSSPEVAALAAMVKSIYPEADTEYFKEILATTSEDLGGHEFDKYYGWGLVNFGKVAETVVNSQHLSKYTINFNVVDNKGNAVKNPEIEVTAAEDITWQADEEFAEGGTWAKGTVVPQNADGTYTLHRGLYNYTVVCDGYYKTSGTFRTAAAEQEIAVVMDITYQIDFEVTDKNGDPVQPDSFIVENLNTGVTETVKSANEGRVVYRLPQGSYAYTAELDGYQTAKGTFDVKTADRALAVKMYKADELCTVSFACKDKESLAEVAGVAVAVKNSDSTILQGNADGTYALAKGETYTYITSKYGYEDEVAEFTVNNGATQTVEILLEVSKYTVDFNIIDSIGNDVEDPQITVKDSDGNVVSPGKTDSMHYNLNSGFYTYEIKAEGYVSATGTFVISSASKKLSVVLEGLPYTVEFKVTAEGRAVENPTITVKNSRNTVLKANADGTYALPNDSYTYKVYKQNYITKVGDFKVKNQNLVVNVDLKPAGDSTQDYAGGSGTAEDPYLIANEAQLRHLAEQTRLVYAKNSTAETNVKGTVSGYYELVDDIVLSDEEWLPIGNYENTGNYIIFSGNFDGNGHTISNLHFNDRDYNSGTHVGLFGDIYGATISNVVVQGSISGYTQVGGIVGYAYFDKSNSSIENYIINCGSEVELVGKYGVGGIVGSAHASGNGSTSDYVGKGTHIINCYNKGNITASLVDGTINFNAYKVGGIVGNSANTVIQSCYNRGNITAGKEVGGIAGYASANVTMDNCYNAGTVVQKDVSNDAWKYTGGSLVGSAYGPIKNCYALDTSAQYLLGADNVKEKVNVETKTLSEILKQQSFVDLLNTKDDVVGNDYVVTGDYPLLAWEASQHDFFAEMPEILIEPTGNDEEHPYLLNAEAEPLSATVKAVTDGGTLTYQWYKCADQNGTSAAAIDGANGTVGADGVISFTPPTNEVGKFYYYAVITNSVIKDGVTETNSNQTAIAQVVVVSSTEAQAPVINYVNRSQKDESRYDMNAKVTTQLNLSVEAESPDGGTLSYQWYSNNNTIGDGTLVSGAKGASYSVDTSKEDVRYYRVEITNTLSPGNQNTITTDWIKVTIRPYTIDSAIDIYDLASAVNGGQSFANYTITVNTDVDLSTISQNWTPIGSVDNPFEGTFDGQGHVISGINVGSADNPRDYVGLFGYGKSAVIKDLVVKGSAVGRRSVGLLLGSGSNLEIVNCGSYGTVDGKFSVGGLVGSLFSGTVAYSSNRADVTVEGFVDDNSVTGDWPKSVGGVVGYVSGGLVEGCYNRGAVSGDTYYVGGVAGYVGYYGAIGIVYNSGAVTAGTKTKYAGSVVAYAAGDINYMYYLDGTYNKGMNSSAGGDYTESFSADFLRTEYFVKLMNEEATEKFVKANYGYPILEWETDDTSVKNPENASEPYIKSITNIEIGGSNKNYYAMYYQGDPAKTIGIDAVSPDGGKLTYQWYKSDDGETYTAFGEAGTLNGTEIIELTPDTSALGTVFYRCQLTNINDKAEVNKTKTVNAPVFEIEIQPVPGGRFYLKNPDQPNSAENPYIIDTPAKLACLAQQVNAGNAYAGQYFSLEADLELAEYENWIPIGTDDKIYFSGCFMGNYHKITGLNISGSDEEHRALFGSVRSGRIENLAVYGKVNETGSAYTTGGVVGYGYTTEIENVINGVDVNGCSRVGGVIAYAYRCRITDCINLGKITANSENSYNVGGIAGSLGHAESYINNCVDYGIVKGAVDDSAPDRYGAIVGRIDSGIVKNCYYKAGVADYSAEIAGGGINGRDVAGSAEAVEDMSDPALAWSLNTTNGIAKNSGRWGILDGVGVYLTNGDATKAIYRVDTKSDTAVITANPAYATAGTAIKLKAVAKDGYTLKGWPVPQMAKIIQVWMLSIPNW